MREFNVQEIASKLHDSYPRIVISKPESGRPFSSDLPRAYFNRGYESVHICGEFVGKFVKSWVKRDGDWVTMNVIAKCYNENGEFEDTLFWLAGPKEEWQTRYEP